LRVFGCQLSVFLSVVEFLPLPAPLVSLVCLGSFHSPCPSPLTRLPVTTLVLGATGLVGRHVVEILAADERWERVTTLGRRDIPTLSSRHVHRVVDFERLADAADAFQCDAVFCALGTTIRDAGSEEAFARVDRDYVVKSARLARKAGARHFLLVSSLGADPGSRVFYSRLKGEVEMTVGAEGPPVVSIFRPSLLVGDRERTRLKEIVFNAILTLARPVLVGRLRRWRPTPAFTLARKMVAVASDAAATSGVWEAEELS
jgi:uncharacterized protein YbjT (DUF2867 family)